MTHLKPPERGSTNLVSSAAQPPLEPQPHQVGNSIEGSSKEEILPAAHSKNVQDSQSRSPSSPIRPIRGFSNRDQPRLPSIASLKALDDEDGPLRDSSLDRRASSTLRASIARLEQLVHEATRLAENALSFEEGDRTQGEHEARTAKTKSSGYDCLDNDLKKPESMTRKVSPGWSSALDPSYTAERTVTSLPTNKAEAAAPILTLRDPGSTEDVSELPQTAYSGHKTNNTNSQGDPQDRARACNSHGPHDSNEDDDNAKRQHLSAQQHEVTPRASSLQDKRLQQPNAILDVSTPFDEPPRFQLNGEDVIVDPNDVDVIEQSLPQRVRTGHERHYSNVFGLPSRQVSMNLNHPQASVPCLTMDRRHKSNMDVYHEGKSLGVHEFCLHGTIARNWPESRKRFAAVIACINTGCIGLLLGIYAGEVPAIQYALADFGHYTILGNVLMYVGLAASHLIFWPLPLLHGRKPYIIAAGALALVLQVPQGLAVANFRDPSVVTYKCLLLIPRALSGFALGFLDINLKAILLDCFGASLQSQISIPDRFDIYDVRKHGGGMGMWLGFVSWSTVGPISIGFMVGACVIDRGASVSWGFWTSLVVVMIVLLLDVLMPEVRRSAFRRTVAELIGEGGEFGRVTRGEIKMHLTAKSPY